MLSLEDEIVTIRCNVLINALEEGDYTSDIVCTKKNGELLVRECVYRNHLTKGVDTNESNLVYNIS